MKLKPLLFLAGAAGAAAAVMKRRGGAQQIAQSMPQPVKDAAQQAGETVQRAAQNAPAPVQQAVDRVAGETGGGTEQQQRYEPPVEGLAQEPATTGGPPSDDAPVTNAPRIASEPGTQLNVPEHGPPEGAVMPDMSDDDPLVRQQTDAAMADAGSIGGNVDEMAANDAGFVADPEMRPVVEHAGDENVETFEAREDIERGHRETEQ